MRTDEEIKDRMEDVLWSSAQAKLKQAETKRQYEREKKRVQRKRLKNQEILSGLRSPGGTKQSKRQVRV
jgi:hypothetical protein